MRGKIWLIFAVLVMATVVFAVIAMQGVTSRVGGGPEGTKGLESRLRIAFREVVAEEPPLRVFAMVPEQEGGGWRWMVEATLLPGRSPADAPTVRALDRASVLCLQTAVGSKPLGGVHIVLHRQGQPDWTRTLDGQGRPK